MIRVCHDEQYPSTPYVACWDDLPGSPPLGFGNTPYAALGHLFVSLLAEESQCQWLRGELTRNPRVEIHLQKGHTWDKIKGTTKRG